MAEEGTINIHSQFNALCSSVKSAILISVLLLLLGGIVFIALAAFVYFKKVKGQERKPAWVAAAVILLGLGVILFLNGLIGLIIQLTAPPSLSC